MFYGTNQYATYDVMENITIQFLNGLVSSMLLFVMAAGLSLMFGQMNVINLAHGSFYMLGGYVGLSIMRQFQSFWLALILTPVIVGTIGMIVEYLFMRRLYGAHRHLDQALLTFAIALIAADFIRWNWGPYVVAVAAPQQLQGQVSFLGIQFPIYRLSLIAFGLTMAILLWIIIEHTRIGSIVRAGVSDARLVSGLGININFVFAGIFALGTALAALAGVIGAPVHNLYPGLDFEILILTLAVVVVGGLGTIRGAFLGSLLIGMADTFGKAFLPELALFVIFAMMAMVLLLRPYGLLGLQER